jgi:AraC-like DNA-binding protein
MKLAIKNMVCPRCVMVVRDVLTASGYQPLDVRLGSAEIDVDGALSASARDDIARRLSDVGFELLADEDVAMVERIKIALLHFARVDGGVKVKLSTALEDEIGRPYKQLAAVFSRLEERTIENYFICQRIEYVKELISYGDLTLAEIADKTGYSGVAYLSKQFAQVVGMTITAYRAHPEAQRNSLTEV